MKHTRFLIISLALCLGPAACRRDPKPAQTSLQKPADPKVVSTPPSVQADRHGTDTVPAADPNPTISDLPARKTTERSAEEILREVAEQEKAEVFDVPLTKEAAQDRNEAWGKLISANPTVILEKEQYLYAQELLDRYSNAPLLERLVIWRLLDLRLNHQVISITWRFRADANRDLWLGLNRKLSGMLYSSLGEDPEKLPEFLAVRKGIEMLKAAAPRVNQHDN